MYLVLLVGGDGLTYMYCTDIRDHDQDDFCADQQSKFVVIYSKFAFTEHHIGACAKINTGRESVKQSKINFLLQSTVQLGD